MNFKTYKKGENLYFKYIPIKKIFRKKEVKKDISDNPFGILTQLNLK